jgi:hypothetical protein
MPEREALWLVELAKQCGLYQATMSGILPIPWTEIRAWQKATGYTDYWLAETIRGLSKDYVNEFNEAKDPARVSPLLEVTSKEDHRAKVSNQLKKFKENNK